MTWDNIFSAFVGALSVWIFNEYGKKREIDRDRRALIGRALSCLLMLHHKVRIIEDYTEHLATQLSLPESGRRAYKMSMEYILPEGKEFASRYEEAIDQLSETDPVTAFELRERAKIALILRALPNIPTIQGMEANEIALAEQQIKNILLPILEEAIHELARLHGSNTKSRVNDILNSSLELPLS